MGAPCSVCGQVLRFEADPDVMKAHLDTQHYSRARFPVPEPYVLLHELFARPGQTAHQLASGLGHRVTCRERRLTYPGCVQAALDVLAAAGTAQCRREPGGRGKAGYRRAWYATVRL